MARGTALDRTKHPNPLSFSMSEIFEPPRCPSCGAVLNRVFENHYETYTFNPEAGAYTVDGTAEAKCPECGAALYDVFPDGVCNFQETPNPLLFLVSA